MSKRLTMKSSPKRPELDRLLKDARTPTEKELREQRKSWARQDKD